MGKESKKEWIYVCKTDSLCSTPETNTTLQIDYTPIKVFLKKKLFFFKYHISKKEKKLWSYGLAHLRSEVDSSSCCLCYTHNLVLAFLLHLK